MNPFRRQSQVKESPFELGVISNHHTNANFVPQCLTDLPEALKFLDLGFRELRIVTEFEEKQNWTAIESLREGVQNEPNEDGWTIDHFLYQSKPRLEFAPWETLQLARKPERRPRSFVLP
ncbi:hypothetical protein BBP40_010951, partial [Aspergillus hancockii]